MAAKLKNGDFVYDRWRPVWGGVIEKATTRRVYVFFFTGGPQKKIVYDHTHANEFLVKEK